MAKRKSITVTISRTRQVQSYEPIVVSLTETIELEDGDEAKKIRRSVARDLIASADKLALEACVELANETPGKRKSRD